MIVSVDTTNLFQAATIHSISWQESHRDFCTPDFVAAHTPDRQRDYLSKKMNSGTKVYMLVEEKPVGIVSVTKSPMLNQSSCICAVFIQRCFLLFRMQIPL